MSNGTRASRVLAAATCVDRVIPQPAGRRALDSPPGTAESPARLQRTFDQAAWRTRSRRARCVKSSGRITPAEK